MNFVPYRTLSMIQNNLPAMTSGSNLKIIRINELIKSSSDFVIIISFISSYISMIKKLITIINL